MGMFNRVTIWGECPECRTLLSDWQTKSAEVYGKYPVANLLVDIEFSDLSAGNIYTLCPTCRAWLEFAIEEQVPVHRDKKRDFKNIDELSEAFSDTSEKDLDDLVRKAIQDR